ncbi:MAG: NADH-quinone oxidoreductase subunit N [Amoebophilaceae bacterium]|nr:NADH-quinone oxidoreductase subunit N [Amoebophilaceae bacterium]
MNDQLVLQHVQDNLASWPLLLPEVLVVIAIVTILVWSILLPRYQHYWLFPVALLGVSLAWCSKYWLGSQLKPHQTLPLFHQLLVLDPLTVFFCLLLLSIAPFLLLLTRPRAYLPSRAADSPAYVVLLLGSLLGSCLLVMAFHWLTIYLGLTLLSLTSALLIGSHTTLQSAEASLKYLLYSMTTTAMMLWGMAYYYGLTGTLALSLPDVAPSGQTIPEYILLAMLLLCLSHIFFVFATAPYHFWVPDVYQGAPTVVVSYLSTVPKLATVAVLLRLFHQCLPQLGPALLEHAQQGMAVLSLLTIIVGNTAALLQNNLQRLMAYGSIAQGGLLMAGIATSLNSQVCILYYSAIYGVMGLATWVGIKVLQHLTNSVHLQDCVGLGRRLPVLGSSITVVILSLIGLPPTAGFTGKFLVFTALWEHIQRTGSPLFVSLLVVGLLGTVLSLYYYLQLPYVLFCKAARLPSSTRNVNQTEYAILSCLAILLLAGFFAADSLLRVLGNWLD